MDRVSYVSRKMKVCGVELFRRGMSTLPPFSASLVAAVYAQSILSSPQYVMLKRPSSQALPPKPSPVPPSHCVFFRIFPRSRTALWPSKRAAARGSGSRGGSYPPNPRAPSPTCRRTSRLPRRPPSRPRPRRLPRPRRRGDGGGGSSCGRVRGRATRIRRTRRRRRSGVRW